MAISQDKIRAKVFAIREAIVSPNVTNEQICLALQYYDNDVNRTIYAFIEDGASEALQQWETMGGKGKAAVTKSKKKKGKNKKKSGIDLLDTILNSCSEIGSEAVSELADAPSSAPSTQLETNNLLPADSLVADDVTITSSPESTENDVVESSSSPLSAADLPGSTSCIVTTAEPDNITRPSDDIATTRSNHLSSYQLQTRKGRDQIKSVSSDSHKPESSVDLTTTPAAPKKPPMNLEKSFKDLHRQKVSLERLKMVLGDNVDKSFKRVAEVFREIRKELADREASIVAELNEVKANANKVLLEQETRAKNIYLQADRTSIMNETDLLQLRTNIKDFVGNRKVYEDMCSARIFSCSVSQVIEDIRAFGQVSPAKVPSGSQPTSSTVLLQSVPSDIVSSSAAPVTSSTITVPSATVTVPSSTITVPSSTITVPSATITTNVEQKVTPPNKPASKPASKPVSSGLQVLVQSESLTRYEENEKRLRLENANNADLIVLQGSTSSEQVPRPSLTPAEQTVLNRPSQVQSSSVRPRVGGSVRGRETRQNSNQYEGSQGGRSNGSQYEGGRETRPNGSQYEGGRGSRSNGSQYEGSRGSRSNSSQYEGGRGSRSNGSQYEGSRETRPNSSQYEGGRGSRSNGSQYEGSRETRPNSSQNEEGRGSRSNGSQYEGSRETRPNSSQNEEGRGSRSNGSQYERASRSYASTRTFYNSQVAESGPSLSESLDRSVARSPSRSGPPKELDHRAASGTSPAKDELSTAQSVVNVAHNGHTAENGTSPGKPIASPSSVMSTTSHRKSKSSAEDPAHSPTPRRNGFVSHSLSSAANGVVEGTGATTSATNENLTAHTLVDVSNGLPQRARNHKLALTRPSVPLVENKFNSLVIAEGQSALSCSG